MMKQFAIGIAALFIATASAQACPQVGQPTSKEFSITEGFPVDPRRHGVTAGGNIDLKTCRDLPSGKTGWVTQRPDFVVNYKTKSGSGPSGYTLTFRIDAKADTVLLINGPNGKWQFNDDDGKGLNAKLSFKQALPGRYDVWVGSYKNELSKATLVVTELE